MGIFLHLKVLLPAKPLRRLREVESLIPIPAFYSSKEGERVPPENYVR